MPIDLTNAWENVDFLSFSGHKLHAPKGVGVLFMRTGAACRPFLYGGHQERGRRGGTENIPYIVGLAKACEIAAEGLNDTAKIAALRDRLEAGLLKIPYVVINGMGAERLPNTTNAAFHYIEGEGILYQLDLRGICASSGSACTTGSLEPSHVLRAMGLLDTVWSIILPMTVAPFYIFLLRQFMVALPTEILEASAVDGAGALRTFFSIALPPCRPVLGAALALSFADLWNMVEQPLLYLASRQNLMPLSTMFNQLSESNAEIAFAGAALYILPAILVYLYFQKDIEAGIQLSELK